jgi:hypothetical protein
MIRSWLFAALFLVPIECAQAGCPDSFAAKSGLPGHVGDWTTTYDLKAGTFSARHVTGNSIAGKISASCTDQKILLQESETTNNNDGRCELTRVDPQHFRGTCTPRGFEMRIAGF